MQILKKTPLKIHDLVELGRLVKAPENILSCAGKLSVTYIPMRYPGVLPEIPAKYYNLAKAEVHLKEGEVILQWVQEKIE